jgi:hypothetical protein
MLFYTELCHLDLWGLPGFPEPTCASQNPGVGLSGHCDIFEFATTTNVVIEPTDVSVETVAVWSPGF